MAKSKTYELALKIAGKVDSSLRAACTEADRNLSALGAAAKTAGKVAATALASVATAAAGVAVSSLNTYAEFEQAMAMTAAIAGAAGEDYEALEAAARKMGAATTKTATEAAEALGYMALAGWDTQQSIAGLEPILRLSEATQMDLATCSDLVTDSMSALGLGVEEMRDYLDLAVQTNNKANTTAESLMEAFIGCGGAARTVGVDLTELSTALGILANNGTKGAEAGTAMNAMLVRMSSKDKAISAMKSLGVSVFDAAGNFRGLETVMGDLSRAMANLSTEEKAAYMSDIAGTNYYTEMSYLLDAVAESADGAAGAWSGLEGQLQGRDGALMTMAGQVTDTLNSAKEIFMSAVQEAQLTIGAQLAPYAQAGLEYLSNQVLPAVTEKLGKIIPQLIAGGKALWENRDVVLRLGAAVLTAVGAFKAMKAASAAAGAVKGLSAIMKAGAKSGGLLTRVMGLGGVKLALIAGVIGAVAAGFGLLWNKSEKFREIVTRLWGRLQALGKSLADMAGAVWSRAAPLLALLGNALLKGLERAVELLAPVIENVIGMFTGLSEFIAGAFSGDWGRALNGLCGILKNAMGGLGNLATAGFTAILEIGTAIWPAIDKAAQAGISALSRRFPVLGAALGTVWSTVQEVWGNVKTLLQNIIGFIQNVFSGNWSAAWRNVVNLFRGVFSTLAAVAMAPLHILADAVQAAIGGVGNFLREKVPFLGAVFTGWGQAVSDAMEHIRAALGNVIGFIQNVFSGNWSAAWENMVNLFGNLFGAVVNLIKAPIDGLIAGVSWMVKQAAGLFSSLWTGVKRVWSQAADWFNERVIVPLVNGFSTVVGTVGGFFKTLWGGVKAVWTAASVWFDANVITPVVNVFSTIVETVGGFFSGLWNNIVTVWAAAGAWFTEHVAMPIQNAFQAAGDFVKGMFNGMIGFVEGMINRVIGAVNQFIGGFSNLVGSAAAFIGVEWGGIPELPPVALPRLAAGGIVTAPTILEAGEGGEPEAVLPLSKLASMLDRRGGGARDRNPQDTGGAQIVFSPVFNFYGPANKEEAREAARLSFAEFKRMWSQLQADERRKRFSTT